MHFFDRYIMKHLEHFKKNGSLSVCYALGAEALLLGFIGFIGLFTLETLLPTFVTVHFSLTKFFFFLTLGCFALTLLGRYLDIHFTLPDNKKNPIMWMGILWAIGILGLSLYKFPLITIPPIILGFLAVGYLFWQIFFGGEE